MSNDFSMKRNLNESRKDFIGKTNFIKNERKFIKSDLIAWKKR